MKLRSIDRPLLISVLLLATAGFLIFLSASLGLLSRGSVEFSSIAFRQVAFGLVPGVIALFALSRFDHMRFQKASFWIFLLAVVLNIIIFIPGVGIELNGATRWLHVGSLTFQVSEALKIGTIMFFAAWLAAVKERVATARWGFWPLAVMLLAVAALLLIQPDTDTLFVIAGSLVAMYLVAGGKWRYIFLLIVIGGLLLAALAWQRPYIKSRITTFINPAENGLTTGYQIQQSLIAVGSGGIAGRGFGQSIQKFNYLPEPVGDSIFAVAAEEFGLIGGFSIIALFMFFTGRAYVVAARAQNAFGTFLAVGIASFIIIQAFMNIGSMLGILPLLGMPLPFVSQGGTALLFVLAEAGILLNISRTAKIRHI
ncbi:MAG: FtsW/RodA/SpoVE family cell cycle protein [bacterium]|nr:FtsW/RodA/SpoVE family cell cycle protein [bacterium]